MRPARKFQGNQIFKELVVADMKLRRGKSAGLPSQISGFGQIFLLPLPVIYAKKLFTEGNFHEAGKLYQAANKADTMNSPIYLSNLALVQLKLKQFALAEISATMALLRDARFCKARYRRALARQRQGRLMEALVDLASVLTADPMDRTAAAAFETIQRELERSGFERNFLSPMSILQADYPSAYGSAAAAPRPVRNESPDDAIVVQNSSHPIPKDLRAGTCASCKTVKWKREIKTCRGCGTAVYCDEVCQRNHWPTHKKECIRYDDDDVLAMHLSRNMLDHIYMGTNLLIYAMRAIGALNHSPPRTLPYFWCSSRWYRSQVQLAVSDARRRISITNIVTAPLAVFDKDTRDSYVIQLQQTRVTCNMPSAPGVAILVAPQLKKGRETEKARTLLFMQRLVPETVAMVTQSMLPISYESHSFGTARRVTSDLDELYWILEDELANDFDNYYGLQG
ncbi:hypothetical protein B0H13DRAFT_1881190 [Mycena leptocephala]|nr:hypothetical protein B0H13DRAFT_1881190 [Mycena leptocephala]